MFEWAGGFVAVGASVWTGVKVVLNIRESQRKLMAAEVARLDLKLDDYREALEEDLRRTRNLCIATEKRAVIAEARADAAEVRADALAQEVRLLRAENVNLQAQVLALQTQARELQRRLAKYENGNGGSHD